MKPGTFALNPHAASYIPLSKRVDFGGDDDGLLFAMSPTHISLSGVQVSMPKKPSELANKQIKNDVNEDFDLDMDMDIDMDIEYLLVTFSDLSQDSVTDVYLANCGDLEATIEMLNQLEIYSTESEENLPETLDVGDIAESGTSISKASEVTASSSSSSSVISSAPVSA